MFLTSRQIELLYCCNSFHEERATMDQNISKPIKETSEVRMGKGKGAVE
jgi:ribosomal protein L16/L10AE